MTISALETKGATLAAEAVNFENILGVGDTFTKNVESDSKGKYLTAKVTDNGGTVTIQLTAPDGKTTSVSGSYEKGVVSSIACDNVLVSLHSDKGGITNVFTFPTGGTGESSVNERQ